MQMTKRERLMRALCEQIVARRPKPAPPPQPEINVILHLPKGPIQVDAEWPQMPVVEQPKSATIEHDDGSISSVELS